MRHKGVTDTKNTALLSGFLCDSPLFAVSAFVGRGVIGMGWVWFAPFRRDRGLGDLGRSVYNKKAPYCNCIVLFRLCARLRFSF